MSDDGDPGAPRFTDEHLLRIGTHEFHCADPIRHLPDGRLPVLKPRDLVEAYIATCRSLEPARIVELGIHRGGSTALLSQLTGATRIVAIELSPTPVELLQRFIATQGLGDVVRPHYGTDQADRTRVADIVDADLAGEPIDLVIDDASHLYEPSRASFETLFPRVRPGGLYVLENWRWQHRLADGLAAALADPSPEQARAIEERLASRAAEGAHETVPLSRLTIELVLARASSGEVVAEVTIGPHWTAVRRGPATLDGRSFRLEQAYHDHFDQLPALLAGRQRARRP